MVAEDITKVHYDDFRRAIDLIPTHNLLMVAGDYNARIGADNTMYTFHETKNRNGKYLLELALEKNFIIANTYFQKKVGKLWTFISKGGIKCQLDYILVSRK